MILYLKKRRLFLQATPGWLYFHVPIKSLSEGLSVPNTLPKIPDKVCPLVTAPKMLPKALALVVVPEVAVWVVPIPPQLITMAQMAVAAIKLINFLMLFFIFKTSLGMTKKES